MKSKPIAYLLWVIGLCGALGFHRFYLWKIGTGLIWLFTWGLGGFGAVFDLFTLGGQVDDYNTKWELKQVRTACLSNATNVSVLAEKAKRDGDITQ